jgi:hypothetical protein
VAKEAIAVITVAETIILCFCIFDMDSGQYMDELHHLLRHLKVTVFRIIWSQPPIKAIVSDLFTVVSLLANGEARMKLIVEEFDLSLLYS